MYISSIYLLPGTLHREQRNLILTGFDLSLNPSRFLREPPSASNPALPTTTSPHNPMLPDFLGAYQKVAAAQHFRLQHPPESHDAFLARRHAERPPRVSSLTPKLMSSFDLPADCESDHHTDAGCECDAHPPSDGSSGDSACCIVTPPAALSDAASASATPDQHPTD